MLRISKNKYEIAPSIFITILGPSKDNIIELEEYWKRKWFLEIICLEYPTRGG